MKIYTVRDIKRMLKDDGWYIGRRSGHYQYKHPSKKGTVSIPHHGDNKEIPQKSDRSHVVL